MGYRKMKRVKGFLILLIMLVWIINLVMCIFSKGINSSLLTGAITVGSVIIVSIVTGLEYENKSNARGFISIIIFIAILYGATILYSPRYTYRQAENLICDTLSSKENYHILNLKEKTMAMDDTKNPFISKGYLVGIRLETEDRFYYVSPLNGNIVNLEYSSEDPFINYLMQEES